MSWFAAGFNAIVPECLDVVRRADARNATSAYMTEGASMCRKTGDVRLCRSTGGTHHRRVSDTAQGPPNLVPLGFTAGERPRWNVERFLHGDELDTALTTLERNRLTFG